MYYEQNQNEDNTQENNGTQTNPAQNNANQNNSNQSDVNQSNTTQGNYYDGVNNYDNGSNENDNSAYHYNYQNSYNNYQNYNGNGKKPKNNKWVIPVAIIIGVVFLISAVAFSALQIYKNLDDSKIEKIMEEDSDNKEYKDIGSTSVANSSDSSSTGVKVTDVSDIVDATMPSVVAITSTTIVENTQSYYDDIFGYYFGGGNSNRGNNQEQYEQQAAGSGIIIDQTKTELLIVTNNHVVEGADSLKIQFYGSDKNIDGYSKGTDAGVDVAVVAVKLKDIPQDILNNIKKATIGNSDSVKVGEGVIAIGNALGYGQSVTTGVISAKDREVTLEKNTMTLLQTDAAINGGNSGGALINAKGEVIGINVAKYSSSGFDSSASIEGMGFAIPITSVKSIIGNLEKRETRTKVKEEEKGYLGIKGSDVTEEISNQYAMPKGVFIYEVNENGPAAKAGIYKKDIITAVDGQTVETMDALKNLLNYYKAGEKIKVKISYQDGREYKEKSVTVTLGDQSVLEGLGEE